MQKWIKYYDILIYLAHNEGKSVVFEKFIRTLNGKIYKKMKADNSKSYFSYLNKLVDKYSNTYQRSVAKKLPDAVYSPY